MAPADTGELTFLVLGFTENSTAVQIYVDTHMPLEASITFNRTQTELEYGESDGRGGRGHSTI